MIAIGGLLLGGYALFSQEGGDVSPTTAPPAAASVKPSDILDRPPYFGVSCRVPNSPNCDRVGLAVWLKQPARSIEATIEGQTFGLDNQNWSEPPKEGLRSYFAGFLEPANLTPGPVAASSEPVRTRAMLLVIDKNGEAATTTVKLGLAAGWG